jgi:hypothetical protein
MGNFQVGLDQVLNRKAVPPATLHHKFFLRARSNVPVSLRHTLCSGTLWARLQGTSYDHLCLHNKTSQKVLLHRK